MTTHRAPLEQSLAHGTATAAARARLGVLAHPTLDSWQSAPDNRWVFRHVEELLPSAVVSRMSAGHAPIEPGVLRDVQGGSRRLEELYTDGILVERGGRVVGEWYAEGFGPDRTHLLMSVSKSLCGIVVGALADEGLIDLSRRAEVYVPVLAGSAYGDATVQQLMDMVAAADYSEDYTDPRAEVQAHDRAARWRTPHDDDADDTFAFLARLTRSRDHGLRFQYCSAVTDTLGWIIEVVTGQRYADVLSERLWSRLGAEHDARVSVDRGGCALANGGVSCTLRDLARVGRLMLGGGEIDGRRIVSEEWVRQTLAGGDPALAADSPNRAVFPEVSYRNQWWATGNERGNVYAIGIHGEYLWLDPLTDTLVAKFSTQPAPVGTASLRAHAELFADLVAAAG
ncbi:serine hydrolase domain-containing protein [Microbacterium sp. TNHR37B]|uniref:serine hydrolase domain-containing protein n=1 Tax=Microbacterium sp. TNHR37B TaxID=1775956 RepID=UPI0007B2C166|nr:serine hydrolase [Microbacterium sp. TNHR37B]KZE91550.1 6-aminohexanoate-dimer hydrolase [Microbacterium sp. TNHR37B]